jgi:2-methylcitrate dehydratase PrpD
MGEVTAVLMAEIGYTADNEPLDGDLGFWRFHGSDMWDPGALFDNLGLEWTFPEALEYKPYPVFRPSHIALDCFKKIIEDNNLKTEDIDKVTVKTHPNVAKNYNKSKTFPHNVATQSSIPYVIAVTANGMPRNKWQNPTTYRDPKILSFMDKVFVESHPDFAKVSLDWTKKQGSTISSVEVVAKGNIYKEQGEYARGCPHQEWARMTDQDLADKFKENTADRLPGEKIDRALTNIMELENLRSINDIIKDVTI